MSILRITSVGSLTKESVETPQTTQKHTKPPQNTSKPISLRILPYALTAILGRCAVEKEKD